MIYKKAIHHEVNIYSSSSFRAALQIAYTFRRFASRVSSRLAKSNNPRRTAARTWAGEGGVSACVLAAASEETEGRSEASELVMMCASGVSMSTSDVGGSTVAGVDVASDSDEAEVF